MSLSFVFFINFSMFFFCCFILEKRYNYYFYELDVWFSICQKVKKYFFRIILFSEVYCFYVVVRVYLFDKMIMLEVLKVIVRMKNNDQRYF